MGAATAIEWRAVRPEPQADVRSTLPKAKAVVPALMRTPVPGAVRSEVRWLLRRSARTRAAGGARAGERRSRHRRAWRAAPPRGGNGGPANDAVEHAGERVIPATAVSEASRRASDSAQRAARARRREG